MGEAGEEQCRRQQQGRKHVGVGVVAGRLAGGGDGFLLCHGGLVRLQLLVEVGLVLQQVGRRLPGPDLLLPTVKDRQQSGPYERLSVEGHETGISGGDGLGVLGNDVAVVGHGLGGKTEEAGPLGLGDRRVPSEFGLSAVPAAGLVPAPHGPERRDAEQGDGEDLDDAISFGVRARRARLATH
jgi:hypothetical protein